MNEFAFIDYQRPIGLKNDYRTSYYRGHLFQDEAMLSRSKETSKVGCAAFRLKTVMKEDYTSEQKQQYTRKAIDPDILRNPPIKHAKFMKQCEETILRSAPKPLQQLQSIYNEDFRSEPPTYAESPPPSRTQRAVKTSDRVLIERTNPGYAKYLDNMATTTHLDYLPYTPEQQLGIGAKDNITYWTWIKKGALVKKNVARITEYMSEHISGSRFPKRRNEFQSKVKPVPNSGLTTESRSNYNDPKLSAKNFDIGCNKSEVISCDIPPVEKRTESSVYGSRERSLNFITTGSKREYL